MKTSSSPFLISDNKIIRNEGFIQIMWGGTKSANSVFSSALSVHSLLSWVRQLRTINEWSRIIFLVLNYNLRFVYFSLIFWRSFLCFQGGFFFKKFCLNDMVSIQEQLWCRMYTMRNSWMREQFRQSIEQFPLRW